MFEFGRDLRRLFVQARESDDLGWLELISVELLAREAKTLTTDGGRVSCSHPSQTWRRASILWREHARRSGNPDSITHALTTAEDALKAARDPDDRARALLSAAQIMLTKFDLYGDLDAISQARELAAAAEPKKLATLASSAGVHARIRARQARVSDQKSDRQDAAALMDAALHALTKHNPLEADDLRLDSAALALETGIIQRDHRLLDQAGRDLTALVDACSPDQRPLTRARALALCASGLTALATMANDQTAMKTGRDMFAAAVDQFFMDHSPLDWVAIQVARATDPTVGLTQVRQAVALTTGQGTILGALALDSLVSGEIEAAAAARDLTELTRIETRVRRRLADREGAPSTLDWSVDQIAMARLMIARSDLLGSDTGQAAFILSEAAEAARDHGVPVLADRATTLRLGLPVRA